MTKTEYAYAELHRRIVQGEVAGGTRLRLRALAGELNLSEMPIREALRLLQRDGLIRFESHRGATVTDVSAEQVMERLAIRTWLEVLATEQAVPLHTPESVAALRAALSRAAAAAGEHDWLRFTAENRAFHELVELPANPLLRETIAAEWDRVWQARRRSSLFAILPARMEQAQTEHRALLDALAEGSCEAAVKAMTDHRRHTLEAWRQAFLSVEEISPAHGLAGRGQDEVAIEADLGEVELRLPSQHQL
jgi:DNA-binding GntR family transcriptional regulator